MLRVVVTFALCLAAGAMSGCGIPFPRLAAKPAAQAVTPSLAVSRAPASPGADLHIDRIRLWDGRDNPIARQLSAIDGFQSRDRGSELRAAAGRGELAGSPGEYVFRLLFRNIAPVSFEGPTLWTNGEPAAMRPWVEVTVKDGEGNLAVNRAWVSADAVLSIHSPWDSSLGWRTRSAAEQKLHYPQSGWLITCTGREIADGKCGRVSDWFKLMAEYLTVQPFVSCTGENIAAGRCGNMPRLSAEFIGWMKRYVASPPVRNCVGQQIASGECGYLSEYYLLSRDDIANYHFVK